MKHTLTLPSGDALNYALERRQRRTVGLKITVDGLVIHAPKRISQSHLESIIVLKADWIQKKLLTIQEKKLPTFHWQSGETLLMFGQALTLNIQMQAKSKTIFIEENQLQLVITHGQDATLIAKKVTQWYKKTALLDFKRRLEIYAAKLNVPMPTLMLSNAKTRWGSCNSRAEVRLNWRLLQAPPSIINYVVCHELAHLIEMNHSAKFWQVVESIFPDYKLAERELKKLSPHLHRMQ